MFCHPLRFTHPARPWTEAHSHHTQSSSNVLPQLGGAMQHQHQEVDQDVLLARVLQEQERAFHAMLMAQIGSPVSK